jgi:hypothetical protein
MSSSPSSFPSLVHALLIAQIEDRCPWIAPPPLLPLPGSNAAGQIVQKGHVPGPAIIILPSYLHFVDDVILNRMKLISIDIVHAPLDVGEILE